jgi:hypothetical protein
MLFMVFLFGSNVQAQGTLESNLQEMNNRWVNRDQGTFGSDTLEMARDTAKQNPSNYDAQWQHSRAAFWNCFVSNSDSVRQNLCKEGWDAGTKAKSLNSSRVEGYYFTSLNVGIYANAVGIVNAVSQGLADEVESNAQKAVQLDGSYDGGGPHRVLGRYYQKLPWPLNDAEKAEYHFKTACSVDSGKALNYVYLAEFYIENEQPQKAKESLEKLLDPNFTSTDQASYRQSIPKAKKMHKGL